MSSLLERLQRIKEGLVLEADDKYDIPKEEETDNDPPPGQGDDQPATSDDVDNEDTSDNNQDDDTDDNAYDMDDEGGDGTGDDDEGAETDDEDSPEDSSGNSSRPGEIIPLDEISRKLLVYKNFKTYRDMRDSVAALLNTLTEMPTSSDDNRQVMNLCISQSSQLLNKLNDYIMYKYQANSYEINYKNFMAFVLEKRLIEEILSKINIVDQ